MDSLSGMTPEERRQTLELIDSQIEDYREYAAHWTYATVMISLMESVRESVLAGRYHEARTIMIAAQRANRLVGPLGLSGR